MPTLRLVLLLGVLGLLAACGGDDDGGGGADGAPGGSDSAGSADARVGADAPPPSTPFEDLSDPQLLTDVCAPIRDAACDVLGPSDACPPTCDPCAQADMVQRIREGCPDNATIGDVANCVATLVDPPKGDTQFCDGPANCLIDAMNLACEP